ncbi:MAG: N-acetylornithine carbamoyltransferase [Planctomycetota bacterium]
MTTASTLDAASVQHLIRLSDLDDRLLDEILDLSDRLKDRPGRGELAGRNVGMLFFRRSLRTRASFEAAIQKLGGSAVNLTGMSDIWELESREGSVMDGRPPEHVRDAARVLSSYVDALAIRPALAGNRWAEDRTDADIRAWARFSTVPVINMESAMWHPLQALADLMTMRATLGDRSRRDLAGRRIAIVWTHSPESASVSVVHSLLLASLRFGMDVRLAHPNGFELDAAVVEQARTLADSTAGSLEITGDKNAAVDGAHVVYARSWRSLETYGNATLDASRRATHRDWRVDEALLARGDDARLMHAMPVRRNVEATDEVLDGPRSLMYVQAENRLHSQKALLARLLGSN